MSVLVGPLLVRAPSRRGCRQEQALLPPPSQAGPAPGVCSAAAACCPAGALEGLQLVVLLVEHNVALVLHVVVLAAHRGKWKGAGAGAMEGGYASQARSTRSRAGVPPLDLQRIYTRFILARSAYPKERTRGSMRWVGNQPGLGSGSR